MSDTFSLSFPLKTHDGDVTELKLKAPRAGALVKYNDPFQLKPIKNENGEQEGFEFVFNNKAMMQFLSDMTGIDDLLLADMSASDFMRLRGVAANMILTAVPDKNPSKQPVA
ncbi:hypothetical protein OZ411_28705 [Bradyrhizobium sp. Arg237L]|uniref:phage tail assembly protein n=1 Tax=Bradyrhizobium sp. Arg237L TaxID=3003352 RepID=UPI00249F70AC|nr:phage tail assembly protein [Bradyrhizobium sp. Arg237L]MDI4236798.1 hypothetical protein [Bradyrhizobium sp. Arg237L]